jgi:orotidine-5'-phosphate decarboxylase
MRVVIRAIGANISMTTTSPIVVAMDFHDSISCLQLASQLNPKFCRLKIGKELFTSAGPQLLGQLMEKGFDVFLDLKYHDIPNTVAKSVKAAAQLGVWMVNVHASGGRRMLDAAREAIDSSAHQPLLIAVTVLTSMTKEDLLSIGMDVEPEEQVMRLAALAKSSGLDGVVCSAQEAQKLKAALGQEFCLVTPGIRPAGTASDDQRRIVTPQDAIINGSDYLVIGRPITQSENPALMCETIYQSLLDSDMELL